MKITLELDTDRITKPVLQIVLWTLVVVGTYLAVYGMAVTDVAIH